MFLNQLPQVGSSSSSSGRGTHLRFPVLSLNQRRRWITFGAKQGANESSQLGSSQAQNQMDRLLRAKEEVNSHYLPLWILLLLDFNSTLLVPQNGFLSFSRYVLSIAGNFAQPSIVGKRCLATTFKPCMLVPIRVL